MNALKQYLIPFVGLKLGKHYFEYEINKAFFELFDYHEFENSNIKVNLILDKKTTFLELNFKHSGIITVPCDLTNEDFDLPIQGNLKLIVRFGDVYNDDNEELLILPFGEFQINVAQYIYEMIVLSIPLKRINKANEKEQVALKKADAIDLKIENTITDPRWDQLKKLITDK
jgi:uncharacterized metal-binding protein YceD (DUF177 family)